MHVVLSGLRDARSGRISIEFREGVPFPKLSLQGATRAPVCVTRIALKKTGLVSLTRLGQQQR